MFSSKWLNLGGMVIRSYDSETTKGINVNSHFNLIFITIVCLTVVFAIAYLLLCIYIIVPTNMQEDCAGMFKLLIILGFGTICGLLGGKAL